MSPATLRRDVENVVTLAEGDLRSLWREVSTAAEARVALSDVLPTLITTYGEMTAALAADWYDEARERAGVAARFRAIPAEVPDPGVPQLVGWAQKEATDLDSILALVNGGVQKRIANAARGTVAGSSLEDPGADGWQRTGVGECDWCALLIGRGAVYSEVTADFAAHDSCRCQAAPAWGGQPRPVKPYTPSPRQSRADYERARRWMADHAV